jgi:HD superfamily phosphohydrolase
MATIKDSVHDHIEIHGVAEQLLDTPPVQRLRRIGQLGTVDLVYPSANHTRFEHSLGVYHLADRALDHLGIEGQQAERVRSAALLHDIGHCPYSHNIEDVIYRETGKYHDEVHDLIDSGPVAQILTDNGLEPDRIADLISGEGELGQLVSGELDVDRMDYLVRDAHHTGVPYGTIDHERLVRELQFVDGDLVLDENNVQTAESLLLARALMNPTVYQHHVARIAKAMLRRGVERVIETDVTDAEQLRRMDDYDLIATLRDCPETEGIVRRLDTRRLFKRALWTELDAVPSELLGASPEEIQSFEREIADEANVDRDQVILDVSAKPEMKESSSRVLVNGDVRTLDEQSTLVTALQQAQHDQWRMGVYAPSESSERVGTAAVRTLGLDLDGTRIRDVRTGINARLDEFDS